MLTVTATLPGRGPHSFKVTVVDGEGLQRWQHRCTDARRVPHTQSSLQLCAFVRQSHAAAAAAAACTLASYSLHAALPCAMQ